MEELNIKEQIDAAWAAGLFEGEGCITHNHGKGCTLELSNTDLDVLQKFLSAVKVGKIYGPFRGKVFKSYYKDSYRWRSSNKKDILHVWKLIGNHLCQRRTSKFEEFKEKLKINGRFIREKRGPYGLRTVKEKVIESVV